MGSFLKNLKKIFTEPAGSSKSNFITFKVKCSKCGEEIEVKARSTSDISRIYEGDGPSGAAFFLRKEILGKKCNNLIYITVYLGSNFNVVSRDITGGNFID